MANNNNNNDDLSSDMSFADAMQGVTPLEQDKIHFQRTISKQNKPSESNNLAIDRKKRNISDKKPSFYFSDEYEPLINFDATLSFVQPGAPSYYAKILRKGNIAPDVVLDLHGYNKEQAKQDIALLIDSCITNHTPCACIVHGVGGGVLKRKVPHYLMQHPNILAFHQAPLEWGGQGAVLLLIDIGEELEHLLPR